MIQPSPRVTRIPGSLTLVLPAYNEEANIEFVVRRALAALPRFSDDFEIIVVDDGSRDATAAIMERLAGTDARIRLERHARNRGYGAALTTGFHASRGEFVLFMDADRQFDIWDLRLLAPFAEEYDIVAGFRMERHDPLHRRIFAEAFNVAIRALFGVHLRDIDCAFKLFHGDLLRGMALTSPGALINTEIQAKARRQGATLQQVGVHHYPRVAGSPTGGSPRVIIRALGETLMLWWRLRSYRPRIPHPYPGSPPSSSPPEGESPTAVGEGPPPDESSFLNQSRRQHTLSRRARRGPG